MKKIALILIAATSITFAYDSNFGSQYNMKDYSKSSNSYSNPSRGYEKPGDSNYNNMKTDEYIYGKNNSYQGSRAGDSDFSERRMKALMRDK